MSDGARGMDFYNPLSGSLADYLINSQIAANPASLPNAGNPVLAALSPIIAGGYRNMALDAVRAGIAGAQPGMGDYASAVASPNPLAYAAGHPGMDPYARFRALSSITPAGQAQAEEARAAREAQLATAERLRWMTSHSVDTGTQPTGGTLPQGGPQLGGRPGAAAPMPATGPVGNPGVVTPADRMPSPDAEAELQRQAAGVPLDPDSVGKFLSRITNPALKKRMLQHFQSRLKEAATPSPGG